MTVFPQCFRCRHYRPERPLTCAAFPGNPPGIPDAILRNAHDHRAAYPGDGGVRFEADPAESAPPPSP